MATRTQEFLKAPQGFDIIEAQMDRWRRAQEGHERWAENATMCVQFFEGEQWTPEERARLMDEGRPCITKNKIAPLVRLLLGYFRQNRYDIKVMPGNDGTGTGEVADSLTATLKQISEMNQSDWNDAQVMQDGLQTGRGFWDNRLNFDNNMLGEVSETVLDPFQVYLDPEADTYDPKDWGFVMTNRWISPADIFLLYGEEGIGKVDALGSGAPLVAGNYMDYGTANDFTPRRYFGQMQDFVDDTMSAIRMYSSPFQHVNQYRKLIRVLDCQHKMLKKQRYLVDMSTGVEKLIPEEWGRERIGRVLEWAAMRGLPITAREKIQKVVRWTVTAGDRTLHDEWSPYDDFTIVPFFPYFRRGKTRGMIEDLLDPQREINRRSSAMLHIIMTTANSGWMWEEGSMEEDMERAMEDEGSRPGLHIKYREGYQPPQRIEPAATPVSLQRLEEKSEMDLKDISGVNDSALGNLDRVQSGRAIQARQKQAVVGAEMYFDNFSRSRELKARRQLSIVQSYYTEQRLIRIRSGEGGQPQEIVLNRQDAAGQIANNVTLGRYDLAIDEAPISATFMQGQFQEALELVDKGVAIPPDILVDLSSMPNKETVKKRINEERLLAENAKRMEALGLSAQLGLPPGQPAPPVVVDGGPPVVTAAAGPAGMVPPTVTPDPALGGAPTPPNGAPPAGAVPQNIGEQLMLALPPLERPGQPDLNY